MGHSHMLLVMVHSSSFYFCGFLLLLICVSAIDYTLQAGFILQLNQTTERLRVNFFPRRESLSDRLLLFFDWSVPVEEKKLYDQLSTEGRVS